MTLSPTYIVNTGPFTGVKPVAQGQNTNALGQFFGGLFNGITAPIQQQVQAQVTTGIQYAVGEQILVVGIIVGALWFFTRKR